MQLEVEDINEFRALWQQEFNEALTEPEARHRAKLLIELYAMLARPLPREKTQPVSSNLTQQ